MLADPCFASADRLKRFLQFTVEMKLRGEEAQIKEFLIGCEVFDRGAGYDPRLDPIVRVEARRLRQRLAEYYVGPGQNAALRIEFRKGSYAPVFQSSAADLAVAAALFPRRRILWQMIALAGVAVPAAFFLLRSRQPAHSTLLAVVPARWVWDDTATLDAMDESLAEEVTAELARGGTIAVSGWPVVARYRGQSRDVRKLGEELGARRILLIAARRQSGGGDVRITSFLLEAGSGRKRWVEEYSEAAPVNSRHVAAKIAARLTAAVAMSR